MAGLLVHLRVSLALHLRNRMALVYGYLFPLVFLVVFWVLYRHEKIPLLRHMGELLTVAVLGGACFGLPTTLVSDRERGVWRRYRLTPMPTWAIVTSTALARYLILLSAGLLQLAVALAIGMTAPADPFGLWVAFTAVSFAFIGLGLVLATLADNVPAVQALGQCLFLPMLVIGGVAVPLASLPEWAQHLSAFLPGRYAVETLQTCVAGPGLRTAQFGLLALASIGFAGCVAGGKMFRWDTQQRFRATRGKAWLALVAATWVAVGCVAEWRGTVTLTRPDDGAKSVASSAAAVASVRVAAPWTKLTASDVASLDFNVPPDAGVVAPIAAPDDEPEELTRVELDTVRQRLDTWPPGTRGEAIDRVRSLLFVLAVPDTIQVPIERHLPVLVFDYLVSRYPKEDLIKMLTWIARNPEEGPAILEISELGVEGAAGDPDQVRERVYLYAIKFVARLTGRKAGE